MKAPQKNKNPAVNREKGRKKRKLRLPFFVWACAWSMKRQCGLGYAYAALGTSSAETVVCRPVHHQTKKGGSMKKITLAIIASAICSAASADIGFAHGHHKFASDGMAEIGPGERASVFWCVARSGTSSGDGLEKCAVKLCQKFFTSPGLCKPEGYVMRPGHTIIVVGPKGDNQFILSKSLNDKSRADADEFVRSNKFPVDRSLIAADFYDDGKSDKTGYFVGSGPHKTKYPIVTLKSAK